MGEAAVVRRGAPWCAVDALAQDRTLKCRVGNRVTPVEGRDLSSRQTQDVARDLEIG
jgi:hypothetical protein